MNAALLERLNEWAGLMVSAGWTHFLQSLLVAAILALVDLTIGRRLGPPWRCALWLIFFVKLALPPQVALPSSPVYWWTAGAPAAAAESAMMPVAATAPAASNAVASEVSPRTWADLPAGPVRPSWQLTVLLSWLAMVAAMTIGTLVQRQRLWRHLRRGTPAGETLDAALERARRQVGVRRPVHLRLSPAGVGPLVAGLWRPTVYLPRSLAEQLAGEQLHAVLVHELSHVKRGDLWVAALQTLVRVVFFYHPAVWWVNSHLARLREEATDRAVLRHPDIDPQAYCLALVTAAEGMLIGSRRVSPFALGVVETKSQLRKRITMNLRQPRSSRAHLSRTGLLALVLLGLVLVPMAPAEPGLPAKAPAGFKETAAEPLIQKVDAATAKIIAAFNRRDQAAYVATFTDDTLMLAPGMTIVRGRLGVGEQYLRVPAKLVYEPMKWRQRRLYDVGPWVLETGVVDFRCRMAPDAQVLSETRSALTVWQTGKDGLLVKVLAWNPLVNVPNLESGAPQGFVSTRPGGALTTKGDFSAVLAAEEAFNRALEEHDLAKAMPHYDEAATLLTVQTPPLHGPEAIRTYLKSIPPDQAAKRIERQTAFVEGNETLVMVVNLFRWSFTPAGTDVVISVVGKGVHVWQRNASGEWRLLFDLPNPSQRSAEQ